MKAKLSERTVVTDKFTKEELHRDERNSTVRTQSKEEPGRPMVGHVRLVDVVRASYGFQSVETQVGIELPFATGVSSLRGDARKAYAIAEELVSEKLAEKAEGLDTLVRELARKYRS